MILKKCTALLLVFCMIIASGVSGCGDKKQDDKEAAFFVYYLNSDGTDVTQEEYDLSADTPSESVDEVLALYRSDSIIEDVTSPLTDGVEVEKYSIDDQLLNLYFNDAYSSLEKSKEIMIRASIVETMVHIDGIDSVEFYVDGNALTDASGDAVGKMSEESFVINPSQQFNSYQEATLTLYFASSDGQSLVEEEREVHYVSSISIEKLVVEQLISGPDSETLKATIPTDTNVVSVTVTDGICNVNFDNGFLTAVEGVAPQVTIYSIVDSLFALGGIRSVQISVNGENKVEYQNAISLDQKFTENKELITVTRPN